MYRITIRVLIPFLNDLVIRSCMLVLGSRLSPWFESLTPFDVNVLSYEIYQLEIVACMETWGVSQMGINL